MKNLYLVLTILGFLITNILVVIESMETGNILLYAQPLHTFEEMFANRISSIFAIDLLLVVLFFFIWSYLESKSKGIKNLWVVWISTLLFGLAGAFPLFLYLRHGKTDNSQVS